MIKFYYSTAPNPMKVALCLKEMGLAYEPMPVDTRKGDQHKPAYLAINPNAKVPAIVDGDVTSSTATPSSSISPRRPASSCRRRPRSAGRCCRG